MSKFLTGLRQSYSLIITVLGIVVVFGTNVITVHVLSISLRLI